MGLCKIKCVLVFTGSVPEASRASGESVLHGVSGSWLSSSTGASASAFGSRLLGRIGEPLSRQRLRISRNGRCYLMEGGEGDVLNKCEL